MSPPATRKLKGCILLLAVGNSSPVLVRIASTCLASRYPLTKYLGLNSLRYCHISTLRLLTKMFSA
ncbi:hypothetical protein ES288_D10G178700v1 [Gossypium darwinii]|uniref:Uncharacterized protein n=1 Tax=Gossypium darwinii TaxID=34276 RepID=A0A5D2B1N7_GOSDA|nr:hypothetical protein ES288_D10G178700v1 [Gossypium darwinii]